MSFRESDLAKVQADFHLTLTMNQPPFPNISPVPISPALANFWAAALPLVMGQITEKARSEWLAAPCFPKAGFGPTGR